jgi:hypothetical protein
MDEIFELLRYNFVIDRIILNNFTILNESLNIEIDIMSKEYGNKKICFSDVTRIDINSLNYVCSLMSIIVIEDVTELCWEGVIYKVMILEDVMTFYCKGIRVE